MNTVPVSSRARALKESRAQVRRMKTTLHFQTDGYPLKRYYTTSSPFGFLYTDLGFLDVVYNTWEVTLITGPVPLVPFFGDVENPTWGLPWLRIDNRQKYIDDFIAEYGSLLGVEGVDYPDATGTFWTNVYGYQFGGGGYSPATQSELLRGNGAPMRVAAALPLLVGLEVIYFHVFFIAVTALGTPLTEDLVFLTGSGLGLIEGSMTIEDMGPAYMNPFTDDRAEWITDRNVQPGNPWVQLPGGTPPEGLMNTAMGGPSFQNIGPLWQAGSPPGVYGVSPTDPDFPPVPVSANKNLWGIYVRIKDTIVESNPQIRCTVHGGPGCLVVYSCYEMDIVL